MGIKARQMMTQAMKTVSGIQTPVMMVPKMNITTIKIKDNYNI